MSNDPVRATLARWREDADVLERRGHARTAETLRDCAEEIEYALRREARQRVTIAEAARLTGYSEKSLRRMVRNGKLPDLRPEGSEGPILLPLSALPRKPSVNGSDGSDAVTRHLAKLHADA